MSILTGLSVSATPQTSQGEFAAHTPADYPAQGILVEEFDLWQEDYQGAIVHVYRAGTTTYSPIFSDEFFTEPLTNPQVLICYTNDLGTMFGKFATSVYTPYAYHLVIDSKHETGVKRVPLYTLDSVDASYATVKSVGSVVNRPLRERFADITFAKDFGVINTSAVTNTATIAAAIAYSSSQGGGAVNLPAGIVPIATLTFADGVIINGGGENVTTITSSTGSAVLTASGTAPGVMNLTLDGIQLNEGSIGIYSENATKLLLRNVTVKRFETNLYHKGGSNHRYRNLTLDNAVTAAKLYGEDAVFSGLDWQGGTVSISTDCGIDLAVVDFAVRDNTIGQVDFEDNIGDNSAVSLYGAQDTYLNQCDWEGNISNIKAADNPDTSLEDRQCYGLQVNGGRMADGKMTFDGLCQDFFFEQVRLGTVELELNVPENTIVFSDCIEDDLTLSGDTTKLVRKRQASRVSVFAQTTDGTALAVYKLALDPNEVALITVSVTAEQTNGSGYAAWFQSRGHRCAPATLNYDAQTANFTVGDVITGTTSGATAFITADSDSGATGVLSLGGISGEFINNELITGDTSGSATVNGVLTLGDVAAFGAGVVEHLKSGSNANSPPANWAVTFTVSEQEVSVKVAGDTAMNINWNIDIDVKY